MAQLIVVYWRDIPAQVIAKKGRRDQVKIVLEERFEKAIDRAAMRGGARSTDDYLAEWRKADPVEVSDDLEAEARTVADKLEAEYDDARLK
ncbi:MAG: virulence factor, partial [Alphaproteobacteria bacterium]|nr:virulence factor [Alphaproteobacteria bacterium]